ncbi:MAG: helix-turn-helix transcriptional regulator [Bdellovibrionota bacterium]|nr:helix-turn-helix transcriptional regulator [Bdellovibrionota bacterium]
MDYFNKEKVIRCFKSIAKLIKAKRLAHPKGYSQSELSHLLGYKNGQFISNVERGLCNIPLKMLRRVSEVLGVPKEDLKKAILDDHGKTLENYLNIRKVSTEQVRSSVQAEKHEEVKEINTSTPSFLGQPELKKGAY